MSQFFKIHPVNPQIRLICRLAEIVRGGGVIVYPTDSMYALGCDIGNKLAKERIIKIRELDNNHNFTLLCPNLSAVATYANVNNVAYRLLRKLTPGPYTFILPATSEVPKRLLHPKRKTIGLRVPSNPIARDLLLELIDPLMSVSLSIQGKDGLLVDPESIRELLEHHVEVIVDGGYCGIEPTTVIDLVGQTPCILREGKGIVHPNLFI